MQQSPSEPTTLDADLTRITRAVSELRRGAPVLVLGETTGIVALAAEPASDAHLNWMSGLSRHPVNLVLPKIRATKLGFVEEGRVGFVSTPIPGAMTALMIHLLVNPLQSLDSGDLQFEANAARTLVLRQQSADEWQDHGASVLENAAIKLVKLARLLPSLLRVELSRAEAEAFAEREDLLTVSAACVSQYDIASAGTLKRVSEARMPLEDAENARLVAFRPADGGAEHLAIVIGEPDLRKPVLTRLHSECFTGDLIGSLRCDCGPQLRGAIREIAASPDGGMVLYLRQEGRGIGLVNKLRAYTLQDRGFDTLDANEQLGYDADERVYRPAAEMLKDLGVAKVRLLTNNPIKLSSLAPWGVEVTERVAHKFPSNNHNEFYLQTKATRAGHMF